MADAVARRRVADHDVREARDFEFTERDFRRISRLIQARAGIHLSDHKRDMVYGRLARQLRMHGHTRFCDYLDALEADAGPEWQDFVNALTTNLTSFFREAYHFDMLVEHLRAAGPGPHTIWCCAASTGEEPYSIAIAACEAFGTDTPPVRILATDIDTAVLETAREGVYPLERIGLLTPERKRTFFLRGNGPNADLCRVRPALQQLVTFRPLNLLGDGYGLRGGFTAVFCRNVMIYFDKPTQYRVLQRIVPLMAPGGVLFAGHSESFTHAHDLIEPCGRTSYRAAGRTRGAAP